LPPFKWGRCPQTPAAPRGKTPLRFLASLRGRAVCAAISLAAADVARLRFLASLLGMTPVKPAMRSIGPPGQQAQRCLHGYFPLRRRV